MRIKLYILWALILCPAVVSADREDDYNFARKLFNDGYCDLAAEQYLKFIENYPDDVRVPFAYFMRGKALSILERWEDGRASFLRVALDFPDSKHAPEAMFLAANCLKSQDRLKEAARGYLIVNDYYPKSEFAPRGMVEAGIVYRLLGNVEESRNAFERMIKLFPGTPSVAVAYLNLAEIAESMGDDTEALGKYQMAKETAEGEQISALTAIRRALIYHRLGDWELAEGELNRVESPPEYALYAEMLKGVWLQKRGDFKPAEKILLNAAENAESDTLKARLELHLGDNYFQQGDYKTALERYQNAPESDSLKIRIGMTCVKLSRNRSAVEAFADVLKMDGSFNHKIAALEQLGELYAQGAEIVEVSKLLTSFIPRIKEIPRWDRFAAGMGVIAFQEGNYTAARQFFSPIREVKSPWSDDAGYYFARMEEAEGKPLEAVKSYETFLKKFPGSDFAGEVIVRLNTLRDNIPEEDLIDKVAALSAASINFKTKGELALNWGRLYYLGFKDCGKACEQLNIALQSKELTTRETSEAMELLANALLKRASSEPELQDSARLVMKKYLEICKTGASAGEFSLRFLRDQVSAISNPDRADKVYHRGLSEIIAQYKIDRVIPEVLAELVRLNVTGKNDYLKGIEFGLKLENDYPKSPYNQITLRYRSQAKLAMGDTVGAVDDLRAYMEKYPEGADIFAVGRKFAELIPDREDKIKMIEDMVDRYYYHSEIPGLIEYLGDLYMLDREYKPALEHYSQVAEQSFPSLPLSRASNIEYKLGVAYMRMGDLPRAQNHFLTYAVNSPEGEYWEEALFALAEIYESEERMPAALKFYQNLTTHSDEKHYNRAALERMAAIYYHINDFSQGRKLYLRLMENETDVERKMEYQAWAVIGLYRQELLETARVEAINFAREYGSLSKRSEYQAMFYLEKGKSQAREKNFQEALKTLKHALKKYRDTSAVPEIEYEIGKIYLITNRHDEALDILTQMPDKYTGDKILPPVYLTLGTFYYRQSQMQNALLAFQKVLDDQRGRSLWPTVLKNLEMIYKDIGLYEAAFSMVNRYLKEYPFAEDALLKKIDAAQILINLREYDRAIVRLKALLPQITTEMRVEVQFYLGEAYFLKGDFQQAVLEYMKVKYLDPGGGLDWAVTAVYNAGLCYEKLGRDDEALSMYREIIERFGEDSDYGRGAQRRIDFLLQK